MAEQKKDSDVGARAYDILRRKDIQGRTDKELLAFRKRQQEAFDANAKNGDPLSAKANARLLKPDLDVADEEITKRGIK